MRQRTTTIDQYTEGGKPSSSNADATSFAGAGFAQPTTEGEPGIGSNSYVRTTPRLDTAFSRRYRSDVALVHELKQALDSTTGTQAHEPVSTLDDALRAAGRLDVGAALGHMAHATPELEHDVANNIMRREHQATGLGLYADAPMTENAYRLERRLVSPSGRRTGDRDMPDRRTYKP